MGVAPNVCGTAGCEQLTLGFLLSIVLIFGVWPMTLYIWQRFIRLRAIKKYKREGGDNEEYMIALMGEWYEEGDEDVE